MTTLVLAAGVVFFVDRVVDQLRRLVSCRAEATLLAFPLLTFSSAAFLDRDLLDRLSRRRPAGSSGESAVLLVPPVGLSSWLVVSHIYIFFGKSSEKGTHVLSDRAGLCRGLQMIERA
jgi:hypothetical protein